MARPSGPAMSRSAVAQAVPHAVLPRGQRAARTGAARGAEVVEGIAMDHLVVFAPEMVVEDPGEKARFARDVAHRDGTERALGPQPAQRGEECGRGRIHGEGLRFGKSVNCRPGGRSGSFSTSTRQPRENAMPNVHDYTVKAYAALAPCIESLLAAEGAPA